MSRSGERDLEFAVDLSETNGGGILEGSIGFA